MSETQENGPTRSPEEEKAHLEALFKAWDSRKGDELVVDPDEAAEMAAARRLLSSRPRCP